MGDKGRAIDILLVENNSGDILLTQEALEDGKVNNNLHVCRDGEEGLNFLFKRPPFENAVTPDLILLDLNMPRKDGREVLKEVKAHPELKRIPVVVLTTSEADQDILRSYDLYANCYIKKPVNFEQFIEVVKGIEHFWFSIVTLPSHNK